MTVNSEVVENGHNDLTEVFIREKMKRTRRCLTKVGSSSH